MLNILVHFDPQSTGIPCATTMVLPHSVGQLKWIYVTYTYVPFTDYWGIDPAQLYVEDANGSLSSVITMNFSVMARPCENDGTCTCKRKKVFNEAGLKLK